MDRLVIFARMGEVVVAAVVGVVASVLGAFVGGRMTLRASRDQFRRHRRVELYTDLLPEVLPALERGEATNAEARTAVERIVREAAATSSHDRARARRALGDIQYAEQSAEEYRIAQERLPGAVEELRQDELRQAMGDAEIERVRGIRDAGARLREYHDWLDKALD